MGSLVVRREPIPGHEEDAKEIEDSNQKEELLVRKRQDLLNGLILDFKKTLVESGVIEEGLDEIEVHLYQPEEDYSIKVKDEKKPNPWMRTILHSHVRFGSFWGVGTAEDIERDFPHKEVQ
ncbi:MAG: hypothetical protein ACYCQJ_13750 [Nitrososphaerales archaeon]